MGIWQFIYVGLLIMGCGYALAKNGEPKIGKHSFGVQLVASLIEVAILWAGGFFG